MFQRRHPEAMACVKRLQFCPGEKYKPPRHNSHLALFERQRVHFCSYNPHWHEVLCPPEVTNEPQREELGRRNEVFRGHTCEDAKKRNPRTLSVYMRVECVESYANFNIMHTLKSVIGEPLEFFFYLFLLL